MAQLVHVHYSFHLTVIKPLMHSKKARYQTTRSPYPSSYILKWMDSATNTAQQSAHYTDGGTLLSGDNKARNTKTERRNLCVIFIGFLFNLNGHTL